MMKQKMRNANKNKKGMNRLTVNLTDTVLKMIC